jgi:hypothetical protein
MLDPFLNCAKRSASSPATALDARRECLLLSRQLLRWQCKDRDSRVKAVDENYVVTTTWSSVHFLPKFPHALLSVKFDADDGDVVIRNVDVDLVDDRRQEGDDDDEPVLVVASELRPLFDFCRKNCDVQGALDCLENYLDLSQIREEKLTAATEGLLLGTGEQGVIVTFRNESGCDLAKMSWTLRLTDLRFFAEEYRVELTPAGENVCKVL